MKTVIDRKFRLTASLEGIDSETAVSRFLLLNWFFLLHEERDRVIFYFGFIPVEICRCPYSVSGKRACD